MLNINIIAIPTGRQRMEGRIFFLNVSIIRGLPVRCFRFKGSNKFDVPGGKICKIQSVTKRKYWY